MRKVDLRYLVAGAVLASVVWVSCSKLVNSFLAGSGVQHQLQNSYSVATNEDILQLVFDINAYYKLKNEWPAEKESLLLVDLAMDSVNNLQNFKELKFEAYTDSVRVNYWLQYSEKPVDNIKSVVGSLTFLKKDSVVSYVMRGVPKVERVNVKE